MKATLIELHQAAQYLAAAGISYVTPQSDDSHTNLGWDSEKKQLATHTFGSEKHQLLIAVESGLLIWSQKGKVEASIALVEATHSDILNWIDMLAKQQGLPEYKYEFHYELPYAPLKDDHVFSFNENALVHILNRWTMGKRSFEKFLTNLKFNSPIRIWPHHFDLGFYVQLDRAGALFLGGGLAVPDSLVDDLYFYSSAWKNGRAVQTNSFGTLIIGEWQTDWDGATLAASNMNENLVNLFLKLTEEVFLEKNNSIN